MAKKENYNDLMETLEVVLSNLENSDLSLEDSMKEYEKGNKIINKLYRILNSLEGKFLVVKDGVEVVSSDE